MHMTSFKRLFVIALASSAVIVGTTIFTRSMPSIAQNDPPLSQMSELPLTHPDVWAFVELANRYGCAARYSDGSLVVRSGRPFQQQEFIDAFARCGDRIFRLNLDRLLTDDEIALLQRLDREFQVFTIIGSDSIDAEDISTLQRIESPQSGMPQTTAVGASRGTTRFSAPAPYPGGALVLNGETGEYNREEYNPIDENRFLQARTHPLSTFSIDVDGASYSNVRRFLNSGQLPPIDAVRIEELINYFNYDDPEPEGDLPFSLTTELSEAPWNRNHQLVRIGLKGKSIPTENLPPSNLVFLLDVSGSMNAPDKLPLLKSAFRLLVNELDEDDTVSIVVYAGAAGIVLEPTPGDQKDAILDAIEQLQAGGSTAGGEGIQLAYELARENLVRNGNNRVILATDGDFNVGISSEAELIRLIENRRDDDIFLTVLGFGTGNLQDAKMEQLANHGNGQYAYIDNILEAKKVLVNELGATLLTIAKDVKIQVEFNPARVRAYRLVGYENRLLQAEEFNDDTRDAGELGAGHSVTALYEVLPVGAEVDVELPEVDELRYQQPTETTDFAERSDELMLVKLRYKEPTADESQLIERPVVDRSIALNATSDDFRFASAVATFGMLLRDSEHKGNATAVTVRDLAENALGRDREGYRAEFLRLLDTYSLLVTEE
ncbi:MAG: VWA domain-containing protein [Cyanobacteria bacterium SID2]|nr:VWA domain-containing protein [Cyanobacteria bacterium SID2]MBP0006683.1 VWA domain-containing protein [Cyanobacteria bacterium SBC]